MIGVSVNASNTVVSTLKGIAYGWGSNDYGQMAQGLNSTGAKTVATRYLSAEGETLTGVASAVMGNNFTVIIKEDGTVYSVGSNDGSQLGIGQESGTRGRDYPVRTGDDVSQELMFNKVIVYTQEVDEETGEIIPGTAICQPVGRLRLQQRCRKAGGSAERETVAEHYLYYGPAVCDYI